MARAKTVTWLSLDRWAEIMGINPLFFNSLNSDLFKDIQCGQVWFQYDYQNADRVSRESVARAIQRAEQQIADYVGYPLLPIWVTQEERTYPKPGMPGLLGTTGRNTQWQGKSVRARWGHIISGGVEAKEGIATVAVVRTDADGDGYKETCTVTVGTSVTDPNQIRVFYEGKNGDPGWEIRPIKVSIAALVATITFHSAQIVEWEQLEALDASAIDADVDANYETNVDVYHVYNDPQTQGRLIWEPLPILSGNSCCGTCVACLNNAQSMCINVRDERLGYFLPSPASWDAANQQFTYQNFSACREPDRVEFYYRVGNRDKSLTRSLVEMEPFWEYAVAYYAAGLLDRDVCGCSNVESFVRQWRDDVAFQSDAEGSFQTTPAMLANPLGTSRGAVYAWKSANQNGRRIM